MDKQVYFHVEEVVQVEITILIHLQLNRVHMEEVVHYFAVAAEERITDPAEAAAFRAALSKQFNFKSKTQEFVTKKFTAEEVMKNPEAMGTIVNHPKVRLRGSMAFFLRS